MRLSELLVDQISVPAAADVIVSRLVLDSRNIQADDVFLAVKGSQQDGRCYIPTAIQQGAIAVLVDAEEGDVITWQDHVPLIPVVQLHAKVGIIAARFYRHPAKALRMIGVTGTNGKTSCTHFIAQALTRLGVRCGIIGTLGSGFYGALGEAALTTPDPISLQATLRQFADAGAEAVAMEVSSHSIDQGRINGIEFEIGIFTNLTQDHLDYHGDMATYAAVKRRFIAECATLHVIINADDQYGKEWIDELVTRKSVFAYATQEPALPAFLPRIFTDNVQLSLHGVKAAVQSPWGNGELSLPLVGQFNLSNSLAVLTALCVYGIPFSKALACLAELQPVIGRMQTLAEQGKPLVVIDYAHTPDALEKVLSALRKHVEGKLICVFGCGGDRDAGKRPQMAAIVEQLADQVIVTNDNPRHEAPETIAQHILTGFVAPDAVCIELDRSKAIQKSIQWAKAQDCVLIAGKGAERYQQIGDVKMPFDDVQQAAHCLNGYAYSEK